MSDPPGKARSLRIHPEEVLTRHTAGEPMLFLDARSQKAWDASEVRLPGAVRIRRVEAQRLAGETFEARP